MFAPIARIIIRYSVGIVAGLAWGDRLAADPDLVLVVAAVIGAGTEAAYAIAKRRGGNT